MKHDSRTGEKFHKSELPKTCGRCGYVAEPHELVRVDSRPPFCPNCEKLFTEVLKPHPEKPFG
jgi:predicted Zn-ribbon and HTH transcriptional regulator